MRHIFSSALLLMFCGVSILTTTAQNESARKTTEGALNSRALSLPKAIYPDDARRTGIQGSVRVQVLIDESGKVFSAKAVSGLERPSMRKAAEAAALQARFAPKPTKVMGYIEYSFSMEMPPAQHKVLTVTVALAMALHFGSDTEKLNAALESTNIFKEVADAVPDFANELRELIAIEKIPAEKRSEAIVRALMSIQAKLNASEKWEYEVGQGMGELFGPLFYHVASGGDLAGLGKFEPGLKAALIRLDQLTFSAPSDFPAETVRKLKDVTAYSKNEKIFAFGVVEKFMEKVEALMHAIEPTSASK